MATDTPKRAGSAWRSFRSYAGRHKVISTLVILIVAYGGYRAYAAATAPSTAPHYVTTAAAIGTVVDSLTETGQVSASQTLTLSPQASGQVVGVYVTPGEHVSAGQVVAQLDATDAERSLQSAKLALQNAELSYQQTTATSTLALNLTVAQNDVTTSEIALQKAHDDAYASIASIYSDLNTIVTGLDSALHDSNVAGRANQENIDAYADLVSAHDDSIDIYKNSAQTSYTAAYDAYQSGSAAYKATSDTISNDDLLALEKSTYATVQTVADAVRDSHDFFDRVTSDYSLYNLGTSATLSGLLTSTNTYTTTVTTDLANALSDQSSIVSTEQALAQAENTLQSTEGGSNALTVQQAALSLQQAKDTVTNAEQTLADYTVTAPFSGTIASVDVKKYDQAGSGTSVATLVTNQETAAVTVNEVDASKIKVGQKATLTFDALPGVSIAGTVVSIDTAGTVSQGVVSYDVVIGFDTENASVLPGMSVTAAIVAGSETGLVVPTSAVETAGNTSYVEVFDPPLAGSQSPAGAVSAVAPERVMVTTGLTDGTHTIVESGLAAGAQVVTKTIENAVGSSQPSAPSLFNAAGARGSGGGAAVFRGAGG